MNLRELEAAATPAPWRQENRKYVVTFAGKDWGFLTGPIREENAALITAARNALPLLLDVVDAARACSETFLDRYTIPPKAETERLAAALAALDAAEADR